MPFITERLHNCANIQCFLSLLEGFLCIWWSWLISQYSLRVTFHKWFRPAFVDETSRNLPLSMIIIKMEMYSGMQRPGDEIWSQNPFIRGQLLAKDSETDHPIRSVFLF